MHIAKGHLDNPPSTCDGLLQTRPKQHIWSPLPQVPFQGPPKHKAKAKQSIMGRLWSVERWELSCPES